MREPLRRVIVLGWVLVVVGIALVVIWQVMWSGPPEGRPDRAQVWGTLLAAIVLVPPVLAWGWQRRHRTMATSTRTQVDAAADLLAQRTLVTWAEQVVQRGIQTPAPVRVRWQWAAEEVALPRHDLDVSPFLATDPGPLPFDVNDGLGNPQLLDSGIVTRLYDQMYARLRHGRLVLLGGPGAGKTGAMILLMIEALDHRQRVLDDAARARLPVPVWLTLGSWNPNLQGLRAWVTETISRDHPFVRARDFGPDAVMQLFDSGRIALFLDGLDEVPEALRGEAIQRLTSEAAGLRVVMTSRPEQFADTVDIGRQLPYAAVAELRPVDSQAAAKYLLEGQVAVSRQAWQDVADHLLADPDGVLAKTLNNPLTLSLARSAYAGQDPRELLLPVPDETALRDHLLDQVFVAAYPDPDEGAHATDWLGWLAHHMNTQATGMTRDLCWWQIPDWNDRWNLGLRGGLVVGLGAGLLFGLLLGLGGWFVGARLVGPVGALQFALLGVLAGLLLGLGAGLVTAFLSTFTFLSRFFWDRPAAATPRSITIRWPSRLDLGPLVAAGLSEVPGVFLLALMGCAFAWYAFGPTGGLVGGLVAGLTGAFMVVLMGLVDLWRVPVAATSDAAPSSVYQNDVRSLLVAGLMLGLPLGLWLAPLLLVIWPLFGPGSQLWPGPSEQPELGVGLSVALAIVFVGLLAGVATIAESSASASLLFAETMLRSQGRRVRFMPLLKTAHERQILRQAGAVYQFRHADLQDRLAERYSAGVIGAQTIDTNVHSLLEPHDH